jgi:uncharacterized membrane protein
MTTDNRSDWIELAILGVIAAGSFVLVQTADAADAEQEQCAGVIKAGKNDCATSHNACHSHVETDGDPEAWIYLPKGTCEKIAGARIVSVVDPTPADKR